MFCKFTPAVALASVILTGNLFAADLKITDSKGNVVEVRNAWIDYTDYPPAGIYTPDHELVGVRTYQGDGSITISWERIESITIKRTRTDVRPYRIEADVTLKDKKVVALELRIESKGGLSGETDLGRYSISLRNIANIVVLPTRRGNP